MFTAIQVVWSVPTGDAADTHPMLLPQLQAAMRSLSYIQSIVLSRDTEYETFTRVLSGLLEHRAVAPNTRVFALVLVYS